ncbi:hypothetical protein CBS101457_005282 [Exobasidium rhododendri]|nr:hypothetical protein CBS101457_005282 [Exobasidium rhododendri]
MAIESDNGMLAVEDLLQEAELFVKDKFKDHDPSHDWHHVQRVRLMALNLSRCRSLAGDEDGNGIDKVVLELAALFHDLCDAKYLPPHSAASITASSVISPFMQRYIEAKVITPEQVKLVYRIVDSTSWSKEEARIDRVKRGNKSAGDEMQMEWEGGCPEFKCVSDADRLDAIGSIGILRVAAFSAVKNRPLHIPPANAANDSVPPAEQGQGYNGSAIAHFHEKLLKIRGDRLHTEMARGEAERRQSMMLSFLTELDIEWMVADQGAQMSLLD